MQEVDVKNTRKVTSIITTKGDKIYTQYADGVVVATSKTDPSYKVTTQVKPDPKNTTRPATLATKK